MMMTRMRRPSRFPARASPSRFLMPGILSGGPGARRRARPVTECREHGPSRTVLPGGQPRRPLSAGAQATLTKPEWQGQAESPWSWSRSGRPARRGRGHCHSASESKSLGRTCQAPSPLPQPRAARPRPSPESAPAPWPVVEPGWPAEEFRPADPVTV
jgi:hypothetical protein